jgi:glucosylceramidase
MLRGEDTMYFCKKGRLISWVVMLVAVPLFAQTAFLRTTTNSNRWVDGGAIAGVSWASTSNYFEIFTNTQYQTIQGFGGCFCEIGWNALNALSAAGKDSVIRALFDTSGCNYTFCRMPIGANDFAVGYYSLNDVNGDYQMTNFSLKRDSTKIIPFIKAAQVYKPNLRFWASPWCPPQWMKDNNNYSKGNMKSDAQTLTAYALYLSKAIRAFKAIGINIEYITCQNEPDQCSQNYPTCCWSNSLELNFYKNYMIPRFQQDNITAKILLGVYCCGNYSDWITYFMNDATVRSWVGATSHSWQTYDWGRQSWIDYPNIPFFETEADWGQNAVHDWNEGVNQFHSMINFLTTGKAAVFSQWNMILDQNYSSNWGFKQSAPININTSTRSVTYEPHFWAVKHIAHYVMPGAKAINVTIHGTNPGKEAAFVNPNGDVIICASNTGGSAFSATIKNGTTMYKATFPANSFNTLKISTATAVTGGASSAPRMPALRKAFVSNATLYVTFSSAVYAKELDLSLNDMQGRTIWTGRRGGKTLHGEQQVFAVRTARGSLCSGTYLLSVKIRNGSGMVALLTNKVPALD